MGLLLHVAYNGIFKFFCLPVFILMLFGKPKFLIRWVNKFINSKFIFLNVSIFWVTLILCSITALWSFYRKHSLEQMVHDLSTKSSGTVANIHYIDEKLREAHLFERNTYMFGTFIVMMIIVDRFCLSYFKLWEEEDALERKKKELKGESVPKEPLLKKTE